MRLQHAFLTVLLVSGCGSSPSNPGTPPPPTAPTGTLLFTGCPSGSATGIYEVGPEGGGVRELIPNASSVVPSPDGTKLAFARTTGGSPGSVIDLFVADRNGDNVRQLTHGAGVYQFCWSPTGERIVTNKKRGTGNSWPTWLLIHVADAAVDTLFSNLDGNIDVGRHPWSPDGTILLYHESVPNTQTTNVFALTLASRTHQLVLENGWGAFFGAAADRIYFNRNHGTELWTATIDGQEASVCGTIQPDAHLSTDRVKMAFGSFTSCDLMQHTLGTCVSTSLYHAGCANGVVAVAWAPDNQFLLVDGGPPLGWAVLDTHTGQHTSFQFPSIACGGDFAWTF